MNVSFLSLVVETAGCASIWMTVVKSSAETCIVPKGSVLVELTLTVSTFIDSLNCTTKLSAKFIAIPVGGAEISSTFELSSTFEPKVIFLIFGGMLSTKTSSLPVDGLKLFVPVEKVLVVM